jgi:hypothetical protein
MNNNTIYYIASILNPQIKGAWIKTQLDDANDIIASI